MAGLVVHHSILYINQAVAKWRTRPTNQTGARPRQGDPLSPMLFLLVMDVFHRLLTHASNNQMLQPIGHRGITHQCSLYADDAVLFLSSTEQDLTTTTSLLCLFGEGSGLHANLQKCLVAPICCTDQEIGLIQEILSCQIAEFPITYLGMPLSTERIRKEHIQPVVDKVRKRVPTWKVGLLHKSGRLSLVKSTMVAIPIYPLISLKLPQWAIQAIEKTC